jgi:hypothetical protein
MDNSHKDSIVGAFYAAAEAMAALKANVRGEAAKNVLPFMYRDGLPMPANQAEKDDTTVEQGACSSVDLSGAATSTGGPSSDPALDATSALTPRDLVSSSHPSHAICKTPVSASTLVYWEDLDKHQWLLDVLSDLETYAHENSLAETAEALIAARSELLSHTGTTG